MQEALSAPEFSSQEHGHEPRLGGELEVGLLHFVLDDAAVDVVGERLDDGRIAVWAVIIGEMAKVDVKGVEKGDGYGVYSG